MSQSTHFSPMSKDEVVHFFQLFDAYVLMVATNVGRSGNLMNKSNNGLNLICSIQEWWNFDSIRVTVI